MQIGCLQSNTNVTRLNTNTVTISLTDKQLIDDLQHLFPFFNKGSFDYSRYNLNSKIQYYLRKKNKKVYNHLLNAGVIPRKSAENSEKLFIPKFNSDLLRHFIRGYFDGDGGIHIRKDNNYPSVSIAGTLSFLNELKAYIPQDIKTSIRERKSISEMCIYCSNAKKFLEWIYEGASIYLDRKYAIYKSIVK